MDIDRIDLEQIQDALTKAEAFLVLHDKMNASAHLAREIHFSPVTVLVVAARGRLLHILMGPAPTTPPIEEESRHD